MNTCLFDVRVDKTPIILLSYRDLLECSKSACIKLRFYYLLRKNNNGAE